MKPTTIISVPDYPVISRGLLLRDPWGFEILENGKTWEIRGSASNIRGRLAILRSGSGTCIGTVDIVDCVGPLSAREFASAERLHHVAPGTGMPYPRTYAWVLANPTLFERPVPYTHPQGAVIFVRLTSADATAISMADRVARGEVA